MRPANCKRYLLRSFIKVKVRKEMGGNPENDPFGVDR
jgi:hypothetical protein